MDPMVGLILALIPCALVLSTTLTWAARAIGRRRALLDSSGAAGHAKTLRAVPNIGGVAIFWSVVAPLLVGILAINSGVASGLLEGSRYAEALALHAPGIRAQTPMALALLGCLAVLHAVGLLDDRRALGVLPKLLAMLAAALVMAVGFDVRMLTLLDATVGGPWLSIVITVLWFVVITNAMNFMDNMDGLAAGVGAISGSLFLVATLINGQWFVAATIALLVGALAGFLVFNFPRKGGATIFMGDGGSLVLGFLLAFLTVRTTYILPAAADSPAVQTVDSGAWYAVFMPLCVLAVPLYDLVSVSLIRLSEGRSPFVGDQRHFSHRLRARGLSPVQTLAVICGCAAITGIGGVLLSRLAPWQAALVGLQTLLTLAILALYEFASSAPRSPKGSP
jgi:UDP-GlcNAc:undecaprenyl-phosphate GlcNAc-1-phosphate transferase